MVSYWQGNCIFDGTSKIYNPILHARKREAKITLSFFVVSEAAVIVGAETEANCNATRTMGRLNDGVVTWIDAVDK